MLDSSLSAKFFRDNRDKLFKNLSVDILVIAASGLLQKSADQTYPFRQDSNFWYLTGLSEPDLVFVKTASEEFIIVPNFYVQRQSILGPIDQAVVTNLSGIEQILSEKEGWQRFKSLVKPQTKIATIFPSPLLIRSHGFYVNPARRQLLSKLRRQYPQANLIDARQAIARARMVKQPVEIKLIQQAIDITTGTLAEVLAADKLGKYKDTAEIERAIWSGFIKRSGEGHAFDPIVASGPGAALIHYEKLGEPLNPGDLLVCDVGSQYHFYNADITRTVALGQPSKRAEDVFKSVALVQQEAMKLIKPGVMPHDYENQVAMLVGEQLKSLGLIKRLDKKSIRRYYPHACSHSLGIDVHDSADYSVPLPLGMVMTVEPGIYIPEEGLGVRIEDVVLVSQDGLKDMSSSLPVSLKL